MSLEPLWPPQLPLCPLVEGYSRSETDRSIRTEMDAGIPKVRNHLTATHTRTVERYSIHPKQLDILDDFFKYTLKNGSLPFWKYDFFYDTYRRCHLLKPPSVTYLSNDSCVVTLQIVMQETKKSSFLTSTIYPVEDRDNMNMGADFEGATIKTLGYIYREDMASTDASVIEFSKRTPLKTYYMGLDNINAASADVLGFEKRSVLKTYNNWEKESLNANSADIIGFDSRVALIRYNRWETESLNAASAEIIGFTKE